MNSTLSTVVSSLFAHQVLCNGYDLPHCDFDLWRASLLFSIAFLTAVTNAKNILVFAFLMRRRIIYPTPSRSFHSVQDVGNRNTNTNIYVHDAVESVIALAPIPEVPQVGRLSAEATVENVLREPLTTTTKVKWKQECQSDSDKSFSPCPSAKEENSSLETVTRQRSYSQPSRCSSIAGAPNSQSPNQNQLRSTAIDHPLWDPTFRYRSSSQTNTRPLPSRSHQSRSTNEIRSETMRLRSDSRSTNKSNTGSGGSQSVLVNTRTHSVNTGTNLQPHSNADLFYLIAACANMFYGLNGAIRGREYLFNRWPASVLEVDIYSVIGMSCTHTYLVSMLSLTLELYIALRAPFWHRRVWTRRRVAFTQALIAVTSGLLFYTAGVVFSPIGLAAYNPISYMNGISPHLSNAFQFCALAMVNVTFLSTLLINILTFINLRRRSRTHTQIRSDVVGQSFCQHTSSSALDSNATRARRLRSAQLTFILCARFLVLYGLAYVVYVLFALGVPSDVIAVLYYGLFLNGVGDGFLHWTLNRRFRLAVEGLCQCSRLQCIFKLLWKNVSYYMYRTTMTEINS